MKPEEYKDLIKTRAQSYALVFNTDAGKRVLDELQTTFASRPMKGEDPYETYYRIGQRDLVLERQLCGHGRREVDRVGAAHRIQLRETTLDITDRTT